MATPTAAPSRCAFFHCSSAGVGEVPGSWGPHSQGVFLRGHLPLPCSSLCQFCSWRFVLKVSLPSFPGPALPSRHPETWGKGGGLPSPGGVCHHPSQRYSQAWRLAACGGARTSLCLTSFLSLPSAEKMPMAQGGRREISPETRQPAVGREHSGLAGPRGSTQMPWCPCCPDAHTHMPVVFPF